MAKKKQKEEEKLEEKKRAFLAKVARQFLNDAAEDGFSVEDITELAVRLSYVMVRFSYLASMPKDMSEEKKNKASEIATMFYMAYYGRGSEKALREMGLSYGQAKKEINKAIAKDKKKKVVKKDKEE